MIEKNDPNRKKICENVIETVKEQDIKFIYLQFTDIHGIIKSFEINSKRIEDFLEIGENFDGSSITGYGAIEESDKVALPDPTTCKPATTTDRLSGAHLGPAILWTPSLTNSSINTRSVPLSSD